jgi:outer membrane protein TolC
MILKYLTLSAFLIIGLFNISFASDTLTLDNCIALALENNPTLLQTKLNIDQAHAAIIDANSSFYPSLGLSTGYRLGGTFSDTAKGSFSTGLNAQLTLYKGGSIRAGSKIAYKRFAIAEENYRQKVNEIVLSVKQAFFNILQNQEQILLANTILKRRNDDLTLIKLKYNVGRENEPNVQGAEVNLLQAEYNKAQAEQNLALAKSKLSQLLDRPDEDISIRYEDTTIEFPGLDSTIKTAEAERPEIIAERINQEVIQTQISQAKSNYFPSVSLSSSYGLGGEKFLDQKSNWSAGIGLSLPLIDGFSTKAKVREANISLKQEYFKLIDLAYSIEQEVKQAYSDWILAIKNLAVSNKTLEAAQDIYSLTKLQYEQGTATYFELGQKESQLTQAENSYVNALYNLRASTAKLEKAIGGSNL